MTYIQTDQGWLYLAVVLDLFSRRIVGWSMGATIDAELACRALEMAWQQLSPDSGLIFHSDRGSQYASGRYTELLRGHEKKGFHESKGQLLGQRLFGDVVRFAEGRTAARKAVQNPQRRKGCSPRLAALVQQIKDALDLELPQPRSVRTAS